MNEEEGDNEDYCDYTGELCIGNKMFCEECEVMRDKVKEAKP